VLPLNMAHAGRRQVGCGHPKPVQFDSECASEENTKCSNYCSRNFRRASASAACWPGADGERIAAIVDVANRKRLKCYQRESDPSASPLFQVG